MSVTEIRSAPPRVDWGAWARTAARRFVLAILVNGAVMFALLGLGVRDDLAQPIASSAGFTVLFFWGYPAGTPNRWRNNAVGWSVFFALSLGVFLLMNHWFGA